MGLFGRNKAKDTKPKVAKKATKVSENVEKPTPSGVLEGVLLRPRITEKAAILSGDGVYTFDVDPRSDKAQIKAAIKSVYNVDTVKIRIINQPARRIRTRKGYGRAAGSKKAYVYLSPGTTIEFI